MTWGRTLNTKWTENEISMYRKMRWVGNHKELCNIVKSKQILRDHYVQYN